MKPGAKILLSIGGEVDKTFSTLDLNHMSEYANSLIADINYLNSLVKTPTKITGIDLDIESSGNQDKITSLAKEIHNKGFLVSIAPQASTILQNSVDPTHPTNFILTANGHVNVNDYGPAVAQGYVDYINLQAYNSGAGTITINGSDETQPNFHENMAHVLNTLVSDNCGTLDLNTHFYGNGNQVCIPTGTKVTIGTVANATAGGENTMWKNEDRSTSSGNGTILSAFTTSVKNSTQYPNYGGVMVWALTNDYYPSAWGGNTWDPVGAFTENIKNFGFDSP